MSSFLKEQIITYMGNKRKLLYKIEEIIQSIQDKEGRRLHIGDGFAGSGVVSRLFKKYASTLYTNDIADYSETLNQCFLSNINEQEHHIICEYIETANKHANEKTTIFNKPYISGTWSPKGEITEKSRVYFTEENGERIDIIRNYIDTLPNKYKPYVLAPLIIECSIHNNTSGHFSAFYKNEKGKGQYGGKNHIDLKRITQPITLKMPLYHNSNCKVVVNKMDTNEWVKTLPKLDLVYYDPPYNKHPYSIYYFLLNIINNWEPIDIPDTNRGQPLNWEKSNYNSSCNAEQSLTDLIKNTNSTYILLSYNNGGIIKLDKLDEILSTYGEVTKIPVEHKTYNKLKGISEYKKKEEKEKIKEFFWLLKKN